MADSTETKCGICFEEYDAIDRKPVILHDTGDARNHMMCAHCHKKWVKDGNNKKCPECNSIIKEPQVHMSPLHHSDDDITHAKQVVSCKRCSDCDDEALSRCTDCRVYLCRDCKTAHIKKKSFRNHEVQDLASLSLEEMENFQEASICEDHGLVQDVYCTKCEVPCCLRCEEHSCHTVKKLAQVLKNNAVKIVNAAKFVLERKEDILKQVDGLEKNLREVGSKTTLEEDAINGLVQEIIRTVQNQGKILQQQLRHYNSELSTSLETDIRKRKVILQAMTPIENFLNERKPMGDVAALNLQKTILKCASDIDEIGHAEDDTSQGAAKFVPCSDLDVTRFRIGYVHGSVLDDDKSSQKGYAGLPSLENDIRMLIIGKKNSGRTRTSFALMGQETKPSSRLFTRTFRNRSFCLRRSPGIVQRNVIDKEREDIKQFVSPGPHIILLCVKNPDEDVALVSDYADIFNGDMTKHMIVIFTGKKDLVKKKISLEKYVQGVSDGPFERILKSVGKHMVTVSTDDKDSFDVFREDVFKMACDIVHNNRLQYLPLR